MKQGMTKNSAGMCGKIEELSCMGDFAASTGGSQVQRRIERNYSKVAHATDAKASAKALADGLLLGEDVSKPYRIF